MNIHAQVYEFAASAGALEGYVYHRGEVDMKALTVWIQNLVSAYGLMPAEVLGVIQPGCDRTVGRAVRSLIPLLGEDHELVEALESMVKGPLPASPDDFEKVKWFQK
jgi:hypothetical protein